MFEIAERREYVSLLGHPLEQINQRCARALNRVARDAQLFRDRVGRTKTDSADRAREDVRVLRNRFERVAPVNLLDAPAWRRRDSMAAQEHGEFAEPRRIAPRGNDSLHDQPREPAYLVQTLRRRVEHGRQRGAKVGDDTASRAGPSAFLFGAEVPFCAPTTA